MKLFSTLTAILAVATLGLGIASAQQATDPGVKARQAVMVLYGHNLGLLGGMAQGKIDYDAEAASKAADSLAFLVQLDQSRMWAPGTDNSAMEGTRALPAIWENFPDVFAKSQSLVDAAMAMQMAAGTDLESLQGAMGALGGACGACHKSYRASN